MALKNDGTLMKAKNKKGIRPGNEISPRSISTCAALKIFPLHAGLSHARPFRLPINFAGQYNR